MLVFEAIKKICSKNRTEMGGFGDDEGCKKLRGYF